MIDFNSINEQRFEYAIAETFRSGVNIGTYNEKSIHAILKNYIEPDKSKQEVSVGRFIADIYDGEQIVEIQTRAVYRMRTKLEHFLVYSDVTLVIPLISKRYIMRRNPDGSVISERLSPRRGKAITIFNEIYSIKDLLTRLNFRLWIPVMDVTDIRGEAKGRQRRGEKFDCVPKNLNDMYYLDRADDYMKLLGCELPEEFTSKDIALAAKCNINDARMTAGVLTSIGCFEKCGKKGNNILYRKRSNSSYNSFGDETI